MKRLGDTRSRRKKAVSAVVATILIVMITVLAIGIIWVAIIPMIRDNLGSSDVCKDAGVSIISSQGYTCYKPNNITMVQVSKGSTKANVTGLKFSISSGGNSYDYDEQKVAYATADYDVFYLNTSEFEKIEKISVVPSLKSGDSEKSCSIISLENIPLCSANINLVAVSAGRLIGRTSVGAIDRGNNNDQGTPDCVSNNSCAQNICTNVNCTDSCGNVYIGTKESNCSCAESLLSSENCSDGCGGNCTGKIEPILTTCYQESADKTSSCGGLGTGSYYSSDSWYSYPNLFDGDWKSTTLAESGYYDHYAYLYINYSKPAGSTNSSLWRVKDQNAEVNLTIPQSCWDNDVTILQLRIGSKWYDRIAQVTWDCLTNSGWTTLRNPTQVANLYEEGMWWEPSKLIVSQNPDTVEPCPQVSPPSPCEEGYERQRLGMTPAPCSHAILSDCLPI